MLDAGRTLEDGLGAAVALFPNLPPCEVARALTYFEGGESRLGAPSIVQRLAGKLAA